MIHLVDDDSMVLDSFRTLLSASGRAFSTYPNIHAFLDQVAPDTWGVVLLNFRLGAETALDALRLMRERKLDFPVVVHSGEDEVPLVVRAMKAGATNYLVKPVAPETMMAALDRALEEEAALRAPRAARLEALAKLAVLTPREHEVLERLLQGERNKAVAEKLEIAPKTVEHHRAAIFRKMGVASLAAAAIHYNAAKARGD